MRITTSSINMSRFLLASFLALVITTPTITAQVPTNPPTSEVPVMEPPVPVPTLWDLVTLDRDFLTLETAMMLADVTVLAANSSGQNYTLLAPDNESFGSVNGKYLQVEWTNYLRAMMEYHILTGSILVDDLIMRHNVTVIMLPTLFTGKFVLLTEDDPFTFNDRGLIIDGNIPASNGVLHKLNSVLIQPSMQFSLMELISQHAETSIFYSLLSQAQALHPEDDLLDNAGPWTVFVPSNRAFANYDMDTLLSSNENLLAMVRSHVTPNIVLAYQQQSYNTLVTMLSQETVQVSSTGMVHPSGATFIEADTMASDGVWHLINTPLSAAHVLPLIPVDPSSSVMTETPLSTSRASARQGSNYTTHNVTNTTQLPAPLGRECNDLELAYATVCCPLEDIVFQEFCISLFNKPLYNSSGMIEAHEQWIGSYPIDGSVHD
jgi:uncharacterized surface protein with fasciclin (FAS1) repeats